MPTRVCHKKMEDAELAVSSPAEAETIASILTAPTRGGMTRLSGPRVALINIFIFISSNEYRDGRPAKDIVTHPSTIRARRSITLLM